MSPTARTLKVLREGGLIADVVERWIPGANIRKDLFGFIDILAMDGPITIGIQCTSGSHVADRIKKILSIPAARIWLTNPERRIAVHGWRKLKDGWTLRAEEITLPMFETNG